MRGVVLIFTAPAADTAKASAAALTLSGSNFNIGSINNINDIMNGRGMFSKLGEHWFDEYWMNYKKITIQDADGSTKKISTLKQFVEYKNGDASLIVIKKNGAE